MPVFRSLHRHGRRRFALGFCALLAVAACSTPHRQPSADDPELRRYAERAYQPERRYGAEQSAERWLSADPAAPGEIPVGLSLPREAGRYPLIVYLPGLGESVEAGRLWRSAWVEAGYAVLTLQPERYGAAALQGRYAKSADFTQLARENYGATALGERLRAVQGVLAEVERRIERGAPPYNRIDPERLVLAGYDLGAQTVQALVGEQVPGVTPPPLKHPPRAAILLSPYANAAGGLARRFGDIALPVLVATATEDSDSFGVVTSFAARLAPFNYMPSGDKYLLLLSGGSHRVLGGSGQSAPEEGERGSRGGPGGRDGNGPSGGGGPGGGGMPPGGGHGGMGGGMGGGRNGAMGGGPGGNMSAFPVASNARLGIAVQRVGVAFLDAIVKRDPIALEWLGRDAPRWLEPVGELRSK
jgi:predicted dienelactone hydrolase